MLAQLGVNMDKNTAAISTDTRIQGKVKRTFPTRSFIWIAGDDGVDYYGHISQIQRGVEIIQLRAGQRCSFVPTAQTKGPAAEFIEFEA